MLDSDNSVVLFRKLGWLPIDDVIRMRKVCLMYKIVNGCCPQYFKDYISYVNDKHSNNTRASTNNNLFIPFFVPILFCALFMQASTDYGTH